MSDHEHECGTSRRLRLMLKDKDAELAEAVKALREAREKLEEWHGQFECGNFDEDDTVFEYCRECGTVEYRDHKPDCGYILLAQRVDNVLANHKEQKP